MPWRRDGKWRRPWPRHSMSGHLRVHAVLPRGSPCTVLRSCVPNFSNRASILVSDPLSSPRPIGLRPSLLRVYPPRMWTGCDGNSRNFRRCWHKRQDQRPGLAGAAAAAIMGLLSSPKDMQKRHFRRSVHHRPPCCSYSSAESCWLLKMGSLAVAAKGILLRLSRDPTCK
jgi:hypothetical protein